ncbi:hypothetical protein [Lysobacter sp. ESA13C]|uniref:hypothetical protein n=1 Tax=Lysobacter sp. ESA13C TaxID=2862676 RepID=UPI001CBE673D|nr:hypothetical protein [Lysobacter sp. ESA13C]
MNWAFSPATPTEPGLYVTTTLSEGSKPQLIRWHAKSDRWRLGARVEKVDAFLGPITLPSSSPEHASVNHLFNEPASHSPSRGYGQERGGLTHPPASRTRAFGTRSKR